MIEKVEMFTVVCDNCGEDAGASSDASCWNDEAVAEEMALESEWIKEDEKHYCPNCWSRDDNDNLILKVIDGEIKS